MNTTTGLSGLRIISRGQLSSVTLCHALLLQGFQHTAVRTRGRRDDLEAATALAGTSRCHDILISNPAVPGKTATLTVSRASTGNERPDGEILYSLNETHIIIER